MQKTPKGMRLHIGIFGRRNVGKSSLLNALTNQSVSIVSEQAGTTTDPVEKPMELLPLGPVLFIDTAGIDDVGALGQMRIEKTRRALDRTDVALIVTEGFQWGDFEKDLLSELASRNTPVIVVWNKSDLAEPSDGAMVSPEVPCVLTSAKQGTGLLDLREALIKSVPDEKLIQQPIVGDLVSPGSLLMLVVPIDLEAPRGRLILPQVQTIRDILDHDCYTLVVKEREMRDALDRLKEPPALVITDSQAFLKVAGDMPPQSKMTSFSILFARLKGDLKAFVDGAQTIDSVKPGDHILVAEACTHHPIGEDIGRIKIPRWLTQYVGGKLEFTHVQGLDFPENMERYKLVIHCGSCTLNRKLVLSRILRCQAAGVPITNYGVAIAKSLGILKQALEPFPEILAQL